MKSFRTAFFYGFLAWLIPFIVAIVIFPIREADRPLFESIMPVVVTTCAVLFANLYLKAVESSVVKEGILLGLILFSVSVAIDLVAFSSGPMRMDLADYVKDIGITYLIFPVTTIGLSLFACKRQQRAEERPDVRGSSA